MDPRMTFGTPILGGSKSVSYTGTAGTTAAMPNQATTVRVVCTTDAFVAIGPGATTADMYVPAFTPEYFACEPGEVVSAVQVSSGGTLYATPFA